MPFHLYRRDRARTCGLRLVRPTLSQLSYPPMPTKPRVKRVYNASHTSQKASYGGDYSQEPCPCQAKRLWISVGSAGPWGRFCKMSRGALPYSRRPERVQRCANPPTVARAADTPDTRRTLPVHGREELLYAASTLAGEWRYVVRAQVNGHVAEGGERCGGKNAGLFWL